MNLAFTIRLFLLGCYLHQMDFCVNGATVGAGEALAIDTKIHLMYTFGKQKEHCDGIKAGGFATQLNIFAFSEKFSMEIAIKVQYTDNINH